MTQATDKKPNPAYGTAFAQMHDAVIGITDDQEAALDRACWPTLEAKDTYVDALGRLAETLDLIGVDDELSDDNGIYADRAAAYAVLAQDRGLITPADFATLTAPWTAAGLALPETITGDTQIPAMIDIARMTSDALADELLHAAFGTPEYGAVLAVTGYNVNELLAYPQVRECIDRHNGQFRIDWESLRVRLLFGDLDSEMPENACDFLGVALALSPAGADDAVEMTKVAADNAETMLTAVAYTLDLPHMLFAGDVDQPQPAVAIPQPRQWEPSA